MDEKRNPTRDLPISLQGIETILLYLNEGEKKLFSIRNISERTGFSMRVAKNVLLQLERFNQVERVVEKNNILPKWRITKFGKRVIKEAKGIEKTVKFPSIEDELIYRINIPDSFEKLKELSKQKYDTILYDLDIIQVELSKLLGPILNLNNPVFEDLISFIMKRIKFLKMRVSNLPSDPLVIYTIKKMGEKQKKISKQDEKILFLEIFFFNSIIKNELKRISEFNTNISHFVENKEISNAYTLTKDLREEIRTLTSLIYQRESINVNSHILLEDDLKKLSKNKIDSKILDNIIQIPLNEDTMKEGIKDVVLKFLAMLDKGQKQLNDHSYEITETIPLFALYQLILDENPYLYFTIEDLEQVINSLANKGYIPGIMFIQEDEDHYLKIVQLKAHDISEDETKLILFATKFKKFTLADMVSAFDWTKEKTLKILNNLTSHGILKYSKSFLHGETWYIVSERNI